MADFTLRSAWIEGIDASGRSGLEWHERSVNPSNQGALEALAALVSETSEPGWSSAAVAGAVEVPGARVRIAEGGAGVLLGFVLARRIVDLLAIDLVGVGPAHRRSGIARVLLDKLIEDETQAGLAEARLELAASNGPARALYMGLGFVVVGRRTRYYPDGDDALLLSRMILSGRSVPPQ
jgi:ribosomal-protein-alanine N-acetyltransferase